MAACTLLYQTNSKRCKFCGTLHSLKRLLSKQFAASVTRYRSRSTFRTNEADFDTEKLIKPAWQSVVGLEIHAQIKSFSKLFSGAGIQYGANTNSQVAFFDAALPGTLPVLNQRCVEAGVLTALALRCDINVVSKFDRKHYFYADMPAGYQITQQRRPLAVNGHMGYVYQCSSTSQVERRLAKLIQIQLEQDSGKSLHDLEGGLSLIDLNRAGVGLMEIVTAPDFQDGDDAASFVRDLRDLLVALETCDGKMAEGSLRVDANVSVNRLGEEMGVRTEVKNLNSLRSMRAAIDYEIQRQIKVLEDGGTIMNETRSFDVTEGETIPMRDKENILDYRFMPEPNLPPLVIYKRRSSVPSSLKSLSNIIVLEEVMSKMPTKPDEKRQRLEDDYGMSLLNSLMLVRAELSDLFEIMVNRHGSDPKVASSVLKSYYSSFLEEHGLHWTESPISEDTLANIIKLYKDGWLSGTSLNLLLEQKATNPHRSLEDIIEKHGLWMMRDQGIIITAIEDVVSRNPKMVKAYRKGKINQLKILTDKVVKQLEGKVDSFTVRRMILDKLDK